MNALTPSAVSAITGLDLFEVTEPSALPLEGGIYVWASTYDSAILYHGAGAGLKGLLNRVGNEFKWRGWHLERLEAARESNTRLIDSEVVDEVPLVRVIAERDLRCWAAVAKPAPWAARLPAGVTPPITPREWECFVGEVMRILAGHRSLVGGGAWEAKNGSVTKLMEPAAWRRLQQLADDGWDVEPKV